MTKSAKFTKKQEAQLAEIARKTLRFETLETRKSDGLDFKEVAVWEVEAALKAAFLAEKEAGGGKA